MIRSHTIALALIVLAALPVAAKERIWTDSAGRTMRAEFVRELDGDVTFLRAGKLVTIPLDKLSAADQQIVRDLAAGKPLPEEAPMAPQAGEFGSDTPPPANGPDTPSATDERPSAASDTDAPLIRKPIPIENRTWTDIHGNQTTARYVRIFGANVVLSRGGRSVTVKFHELIEADQQYLRDLLTSHGQEAMIPPKVSAQDHTGPVALADPIGATAPGGVVPAAIVPPPGTATGAALPPTAASPPAVDATIPPPATAATASFDPAFGPSAGPATAPGAMPAALPPAVPPPTAGSNLPGYTPSAASTALAGTGRTSEPSYQPSYTPESSPSYSYAVPATEMPDRSRGPRVYSSPAPAPQVPFSEETIGACSSCGREITRAQSTADNCPHCGVRWTYKQNQAAGQAMSRTGLDATTTRIIAVVLGALVALVVVVCLVVGIIYALVGMATAPSAGRDRPYMR